MWSLDLHIGDPRRNAVLSDDSIQDFQSYLTQIHLYFILREDSGSRWSCLTIRSFTGGPSGGIAQQRCIRKSLTDGAFVCI